MLQVRYPGESAQESNLSEFFANVDAFMATNSVDRVLRIMSEIAYGPVLERFLTEKETSELLDRATRVNAGVLLQRWQTLAALNHDNIHQFVDEAVENLDADALCAGLNAKTHQNATPIIDGLRRLEDRTTVVALGLSLYVAGSRFAVDLTPSLTDTQIQRSFAALFEITGEWPEDPNDVSPEAVNGYLLKIQHWLTEHVPVLDPDA